MRDGWVRLPGASAIRIGPQKKTAEPSADSAVPDDPMYTEGALGIQQSDVSSAWSLGRLFDRELDPLTLAQQLEHCTTDGTPVEEVLHTCFVPDEAEALVDEQTCDCAGRHNRNLRCDPRGDPEEEPNARREAQKAHASVGGAARKPCTHRARQKRQASR